ncbi:hypothetical protein BS78_06G003200 [Paspalum vaginatum]|nr:hypothetical protein BS78_06G003200 [Paspalum vaginatum]
MHGTSQINYCNILRLNRKARPPTVFERTDALAGSLKKVEKCTRDTSTVTLARLHEYLILQHERNNNTTDAPGDRRLHYFGGKTRIISFPHATASFVALATTLVKAAAGWRSICRGAGREAAACAWR